MDSLSTQPPSPFHQFKMADQQKRKHVDSPGKPAVPASVTKAAKTVGADKPAENDVAEAPVYNPDIMDDAWDSADDEEEEEMSSADTQDNQSIKTQDQQCQWPNKPRPQTQGS